MSVPKYHLDGIFDPGRAHPDDAHSILMRLIPRGSHVLEPGCASGYLSGYMEQALSCRVTGLEADPAAAQIAAQRCSEVHTVDLDAPQALDVARASGPVDWAPRDSSNYMACADFSLAADEGGGNRVGVFDATQLTR